MKILFMCFLVCWSFPGSINGVPRGGVWGRVQVGGGGGFLWKMRKKGGVREGKEPAVNAHAFVKSTL